MSRSMSFLINDASTDVGGPQVRVTITEGSNGQLQFSVTQDGAVIGDLRGLFFDLADKALAGSLITSAANTGFVQGVDKIKDLGDGVNMNGLTGSGKGYDAGIRIGTAGIGKDDVRSYDFALSSTLRALTLDDFANVDFAARLTSVGTLGGSRNASSKLLEKTSAAVNAQNDQSSVIENGAGAGNVLANDAASGAATISGWSGGDVGSSVRLIDGDLDLGSLTLGADGSWQVTLDGPDADRLSAGETLSKTFSYSVKVQNGDNWSTDTASFTVEIQGQNDAPVAQNDSLIFIDEGSTVVNASVAGNDSDIDRLDTHSWSLNEGSFVDGNGQAAKGTLVFNADGSWSYDAGTDYDALNTGESVALSFEYTMTDSAGASSTATVSFGINGKGDAVTPVVPTPPTPEKALDDDFPLWAQDISHITLVFNSAAGDVAKGNDGYYTVKIDNNPGANDVDLIIEDLLARLIAEDDVVTAETDLMGMFIKGGQQTTNYFAYGDYNQNGTAADALPAGLLIGLAGGHANETPTNAIDMTYGGWIF